MPILLLLAACWDPTVTGPKGMVGVLVGADGQPVADQLLESIEAQKRTGPDGRFALQFKPPNTSVTFRRGSAFYERALLPSDEGGEVTLALPAERAARLSCGERACDATIRWTLGEGYTATVIAPCKADATLDIGRIPAGTPEITCRAGLGAPLETVAVEDRGDLLVLVPPATPIAVRVAASDGSTPAGCAVQVDGSPATPDGDAWKGASGGIFTATATCGGLPARPVVGTVKEPTATLQWSADPPTVDPKGVFQPVGEALLVADSGPSSGWKLPITARADGAFVLPPLDAGAYRILFVPREARDAAFAMPAPEAIPGSLVVAEPAEGLYVAALRVDQPLTTGRIPVRR